jgi:hypothetical protein
LQPTIQGSERPGRILKQDGLDATGSGSLHVALVIVEEEHLFRLDTQPLPGQLKDAPIWLRHADLMRVDDQVAHVLYLVALLLFAPGTHKAIGEDGCSIARAQPAKVVCLPFDENISVMDKLMLFDWFVKSALNNHTPTSNISILSLHFFAS